MPINRLKLVIADDHVLVAEALSRVLQDEFELCEIVSDGEALVESVRRWHPDLVVTDIRMPKVGGLEAIQAIRALPNPPPIVVLSMYGDAATAQQAISAGASGFVLKEAASSELPRALHAAHSGAMYVTPLQDPRQGRGANARSIKPTPRQSKVLELIALGCRMKEIAARLTISRRTVESHKYQLMAKLGARSTAELVQHALRLGLVKLPGPGASADRERGSARDASAAEPSAPVRPGSTADSPARSGLGSLFRWSAPRASRNPI